ncbi:MAG TPA: hypothetical protein VMV46_10770 [Thermoanaerobaculia bacterium]|nr:hypothetical protein [Thermoanaerobaculia bacterium]
MTEPTDSHPSTDLERLLWLEVDRQLDDAGSRQLAAALAENEGARRLAAEVREVASLLEGVEPVEAPAELRHAIERSVRAVRPTGVVARTPPAAPLSWRPRLRVARLALAAGLVLALGLAGVATVRLGRTVEDPSAAAGAISGTRASEDEALVVPLAEDGGSLTLRRVGGRLLLHLERPPAAGPYEITVEGEGLRTPGDAAPLRILDASSDRLRATLDEAGAATLSLGVPDAGILRVRVSAAGRTLLDQSFDLHDLPRTGH